MSSERTIRNRERPNRERGSALLIVFLFAAVLAVSLYIEMPSYAFEAKRAKEQLLIDRGNEYAHGVKLYYRKFRAYPSTIKALESTNNLRFLRHAFKDPMTGENNWRLLHAGPGGQLTDSKVNPIGLNANGQNTTGIGSNSSNTSSSSASASNTSFGFNSTPSNSYDPTASLNANGLPAQAGTGLPQRPAEMPISGGGGVTVSSSNPVSVDPAQSLVQMVPPGATAPPATNALPSTEPLLTGQPGPANAGNPMQGVQQLYANPNPPTPAGTPATTGPVTAGQTAGGSTSGITPTTSTSSGTGVLQSGGLAGVASLAKGRTIKMVNDQTDYSLWEFYYDPTKDTSMTGGSGVNPMNGVNLPNNNNSPNSNSNSSTSPVSLQPAPTSTSPTGLQPTPTPGSTSTSTQPQQP
jgi:hypothetical protein